MSSIPRTTLAILALGAATVRAAEPHTFHLREVVGRNWGPEVVTYRVAFDPPVRAGDLALTDADGVPLPLQLANALPAAGGRVAAAEVRFLAALPANATAQYTLTANGAAGNPSAVHPVRVRNTRRYLELANGRVALRLPAEASSTYRRPAAAADVPGPIQAVQLPDGTWAGGTQIVTDRKVASFTCELLEDGLVSARVRIEYTFSPRGRYTVLVRLDQDAPLAFVEEEFDFGEFTDGQDFLAFDLGANWRPEAVAWGAENPFKRTDGLTARMGEVAARGWTAGGYFELPLADAASAGGQYVHPWGAWGVSTPVPPAQNWLYMMPWPDFGSRASYIGLCQAPAAAGQPAPQLGVLSLHTGAWRRPSNAIVRLNATTDGRAVLELPIACFGVMRPFNPFDTAEEDPSVPPTLGRRVWGLVAGVSNSSDLAQWQLRYGMIGLDRYKEWVLEWDAGPEMDAATYPRGYVTAAQLEVIRKTLDANPFKDVIGKSYLGNPTDAAGQAAAAAAAGAAALPLTERATSLVAHFRMAQYDNGIIPRLDAALAWPGLSGDARRQVLARIAAMAYVLTDPDFNPRGIGMHLGNPNMPINRYMGFPQYANLLPSHPMHAAWMEEALRYSEWKWADNVSPGGAWREEITYQQAAVPHLMEAMINLRNGGQEVEAMLPYVRENHRFNLACVSPADLNEEGLRGCEGTGNGGRVRSGFPVYAANLLKTHDAALAGNLMWLWETLGKPTGGHGLNDFTYDPEIVPIAPDNVPGAFLPGYGATARAHFGTPTETFLMFRCGYNQSHYDMDQGSFKFYAYGEHLLPNSSRGYAAPPAPTMQHGLLLFGDTDKPWMQNHGRVDSAVVDYAYLDTVDHLLGWQRFDDKSGGNQGHREPKAFAWYRQFLFLKSREAANPSYFVLRDTLRGENLPPSHFNTWVIGNDEQIAVESGSLTVTTPQDNRLDLAFLEPATIDPRLAFVQGPSFGISKHGSTEIRVSQPAGQGYLLVAYPRRAAMAAPKIERLAEGVVKVETAEGTDYVFLSPDADMAYRDDTVSFTGRAGAVRLRGDEIRLVLASGAGAVGYQGHVARGDGPFETVVVRADVAQAGERRVEPAVALPAPLLYEPQVTGAVEELQPGVRKIAGEQGIAYLFDSASELDVTLPDGIRFRGRQGAVELLDGCVRYVMQPDAALGFLCEIGRDGFVIKGEGPYDLTFADSAADGQGGLPAAPSAAQAGEIAGVVGGRSRVLEMPLPPNLVPANTPQKALASGQLQAQIDGPILTGVAPTLYINGRQWQVGYYDRHLALNVFEGDNQVRITRFQVPELPPLPGASAAP